jgi:hypothetical protein
MNESIPDFATNYVARSSQIYPLANADHGRRVREAEKFTANALLRRSVQ